MEAWKRVFRMGIAPLLSRDALLALRRGLAEDDPRLIQGATVDTTVITADCSLVSRLPCTGACAIGYCGWKGEGLDSNAEVVEFFAEMAKTIDNRLGEPGGSGHFTFWFDETPRPKMRRLLLAEVDIALKEVANER